MRCLFIMLALILARGPVLAADFNAAMTAYENQNYAAAVREFSALAEAGDPHAQYMLGRLYARGNGVVQDFVQAHKWCNLAAAQGHRHAAQARDDLSRRMPPTQIAQAQRLAREWKPGSDIAKVESPSTTPPAAPSTMPPPAASQRQTILAIQSSLNELGYNAGYADGVMGGQTRAAIRDYQAGQGLPVDGQPSEALLEHLKASLLTAAGGSGAPRPQAADWPWRRLLLRDSFRDGDYTRNPAWTVASGRFSVEPGKGLRTVHEARRPAAEPRQEALPMAILGVILGEASRPPEAERDAGPSDFAEIYVRQPITNAFAVTIDLTVRQVSGSLAFGPYQHEGRSSGYRLVYEPGVERGFRLERSTGSGSSIIESADRRFSPDRQYSIQWTRDRTGEMAVFLDGSEVFRVADRSFNAPFDGFTLINKGGDYTVKKISIHGATKGGDSDNQSHSQ